MTDPAPSSSVPTLYYDETFLVYRRRAARWRATLGDEVAVRGAPPARPDGSATGIGSAVAESGLVLVRPRLGDRGAKLVVGAEAVLRAHAERPGRRRVDAAALFLYEAVPHLCDVVEAVEGLRRAVRRPASFVLRWTSSPDAERPRMLLTRWLFLRLLGLVYLIAFASLGSQLLGLVGERGILPVGEFHDLVRLHLGADAPWRVPSIFWLIGTSDAALGAVASSGVALSILLIGGVAPAPCLLGLYVLYLSLFAAGQDFTGFQWDILLLEAGFLAIFLAPLQLRPGLRRAGEPSRGVLWLFRLLLFKLMFLSGVVKLTSGDPTWRDGTAMTFHYETQPLPNPWSWSMHHLSPGVHAWEVTGTFVLELAVPFLFVAPRRIRIAGAFATIGLQLLISATGNYGFFNLLTAALAVLLLDDVVLPARLRAWVAAAPEHEHEPAPRRRWPTAVVVLVAALVLVLTPAAFHRAFARSGPPPFDGLRHHLAPFRVVNGYGLFAVMTTERPEIVIEGSADGERWLPYTFPYKPGDPARPPPVALLHMPRLDWQMWFAALSHWRRALWLQQLLERLLEGEPSVLALLEESPFPDEPPRFVRAVVYDYRFTAPGDPDTDELGAALWWRRELRGLYCPVQARDDERD